MASAIVLLAACDNIAFESPVGLQRDGDSIAFALCGEPVDAVRVFASARSEDGSYLRFWDAEGSAALEPGLIINPAEGIPGLHDLINEPPRQLNKGTLIKLVVVGRETNTGYSSEFEVTTEGLSDSQWLHVDGSLSDEPCAGEEPG